MVFYTDRASFDAATSELVILSDGFESLPPETFFWPTPVTLFEGNVTISETETLTGQPNRDLNKIVALPTLFGVLGIDSPQLAGNYLVARTINTGGSGEQFLTFTFDFQGGTHAVGFDLSGAAGAASQPNGTHNGIEIGTKSGMVRTMQIVQDDGFLGAVSSLDDPIESVRFLDLVNTSTFAEAFGIDNLVIGVRDAPVLPRTLFHLEDGDPLTVLGNSVAALGDVDGDEVPDFAVSGMEGDRGIVRVFGGADGLELYTITSPFIGTGFAETRNLVAVGDLDGDGVSEIAVGAPYEFPDYFQIFRGHDGSFLRAHAGSGTTTLGTEIAGLGDIDGDGVSDYAASNLDLGNEGGRVRVYSGAGGEELGQLTSSEMLRFYSIAGPGDLNGDGRGDLAVTIWSEFDPWKPGEIRVFSGGLFGDPGDPAGPVDVFSQAVQAAILLELDGRTDVPGGFESIGLGLNALGDMNGDGVPDLGAGTGPTSDAVVFSGADGTRLREVFSDRFDLLSQFVVETEGIGDLDGDGFRDFAVGLVGLIRVISGQDGSVLAEKAGGDELGEEIAAIGDLDGDGVSEILASAPAGGYAEVISFSLEGPPDPEPPSATTTIYFTADGPDTINRIDLDGSNFRTVIDLDRALGPADYRPWGIAIHNGQLYWTDVEVEAIFTASLDGQGARKLIDLPTAFPSFRGFSAEGIAVTEDTIYWTDSLNTGVYAARRDGRNARQLLDRNDEQPLGILVDGNRLLWTEWAGSDSGVYGSDLNGNGFRKLAPNHSAVNQGIVLAEGQLFWTAGEWIYTAARDGRNSRELLDLRSTLGGEAAIKAFGITAHDGRLYWTDTRRNGLYTARTDGRDIRVLFDMPGGARPLYLAILPPDPAIHRVRKVAGQVEVEFTGILQESENLIDWIDVLPAPTSPFRTAPTSPSRLFRAR